MKSKITINIDSELCDIIKDVSNPDSIESSINAPIESIYQK